MRKTGTSTDKNEKEGAEGEHTRARAADSQVWGGGGNLFETKLAGMRWYHIRSLGTANVVRSDQEPGNLHSVHQTPVPVPVERTVLVPAFLQHLNLATLSKEWL